MWNPFTRGRGVGKLIFTTAMKKAKEMGYNHLYFSTYSVLKVARTMYRELGFTVTDSYDDEEVGQRRKRGNLGKGHINLGLIANTVKKYIKL